MGRVHFRWVGVVIGLIAPSGFAHGQVPAVPMPEVGVATQASDGYARQPALDVLHYAISIKLPAEGKSIDGRTEIVYQAVGSELRTVEFDFGAMTVDSLSVDREKAPFRHQRGRLIVETPGTPPGHRSRVEVWYHGEPRDGLIIRDNRHGERVVFADNWADRAHHWFPGVDHPADKATVSIEVIAPSEWRVVGNGFLRDTEDVGDGRRRTRWAETAEISMYNIVIGAAEFAVETAGRVRGAEITHWTFPQDSVAGSVAFGRSIEILSFFDSLIGPYPYEKLAHVQSATRYGGMENASAIFYGEDIIGQAAALEGDDQAESVDRLHRLVAHETAHQWFGDAVTESDWNHLWLSEGFATYFAAVFFEFRGSSTGKGPDELARRMRETIPEVADFYRRSGQAVYHPGAGPGAYERLLNPNNYPKGAWVLHMLRRVVGDEDFFDGIRDYYGQFRDGTAWTSDFERVMETASGKDLGWFFRQWIGRPGHPVVEARVVSQEADQVRVVVRQRQAEAPFRFPLDIELLWEDGSRLERVVVDAREETFVFDVSGPVGEIAIDPGGWLLHEAWIE